MTDRVTNCVTGCARPAGGYYLCRQCTDELVSALRSVVELPTHLDTTIARQTSTGNGVGVASRPAERPLPVNLAAAEVRNDLVGVLSTWARDIGGRTGATMLVDSAESAAEYLLDHVSTLRTHPAAEELYDELTDAIARAWRSVDRPPERRFLGPCDHCGADVYGRAHALTLTCPDCGTRYDAEDRRAWLLDQARDQLATASTIARALPDLVGKTVTPAMIRSYAHRGRLVPRPDPTGKKRYKVGDVIDLVLST